MNLAENVRGRIAATRVAYQASYERTLGKSVWAKIEERRLCFPPDYHEDLSAVLDRSIESDTNAWHQLVGEIARECPRTMPKHLRLRWVVRELSRSVTS